MAKRKGSGKGKRKGGVRPKRKRQKRRPIAFRINIEEEPLYRLDEGYEETDEKALRAQQEQDEEDAEAFGEMMHNLPSIKTDNTRRI